MNNIYVMLPKKLGTISPDIYGVFAEHIGGVIYDGIWVGENSSVPNTEGFRTEIIEKIKQAKIPMVRWPGGCFAETYNWRDGICPRNQRPTRVNWWTKYDGRYETNEVGTDEFLRFCELTETEPYIAANITSTTPMDIREWMDYVNSPAGTTTLAKMREANGHKEPYNVKVWGVGNETWGGGGRMTPETYAHEYRKYAELMDNMEIGGRNTKTFKFVGSGANGGDTEWTRKFLETVGEKNSRMTGYSFHYYCGNAGDPLTFTTEEWYEQLAKANRMQRMIDLHWGAIVSYKMEHCAKLAIDEWGCWHPDGSGPSKGYNLFEQQSTMRDAVVSALTLNIFNNNCSKIMLTTVAQLVNNLHCLFLSGGENCIETPTYHVFDMYKTHHGAEAVDTCTDADKTPNGLSELSVSASVKDGKLTVTVAHLSADKDIYANLSAVVGTIGKNAEMITLAADDIHAHNTFEDPERVKPITTKTECFDGRITVPHGGIVTVIVDL